jgi:pilus assembly protein CpaB
LKRSNRLVLLVGIFLAVIAFVGIALLLGQGGGGSGTSNPNPAQPTTCTRVIAKQDIALGVVIEDPMVDTETVPIAQCGTNSLSDQAKAIGQPARQEVKAGQEITTNVLIGGTTAGQCTEVKTPATKRSIAVQVDQVSGVGTLIKPGDYVDMLVGFAGDKFPVVTVNPTDQSISVVGGLNSTSVKLLLQGVQVLCSLLPPPPADTGQQQGQQTGGQSTGLTGQQEIVILAVSPQQSEVIKFSQMDGNVSLILRNSGEFFDPVTKQPIPGVADATTGITLKVLVDGGYDLLPPEVIEAVLPKQRAP